MTSVIFAFAKTSREICEAWRAVDKAGVPIVHLDAPNPTLAEAIEKLGERG
jgi:hypothetical protein